MILLNFSLAQMLCGLVSTPSELTMAAIPQAAGIACPNHSTQRHRLVTTGHTRGAMPRRGASNDNPDSSRCQAAASTLQAWAPVCSRGSVGHAVSQRLSAVNRDCPASLSELERMELSPLDTKWDFFGIRGALWASSAGVRLNSNTKSKGRQKVTFTEHTRHVNEVYISSAAPETRVSHLFAGFWPACPHRAAQCRATGNMHRST
jgi:hypothetical protein